MEGNQPITKFKHGTVEAAIFENEIKKNEKSFTIKKVVLHKRYLDRNDKWQNTSSLDVNDVPKAVVALTKAYDFMTNTAKSDKGGTDEFM